MSTQDISSEVEVRKQKMADIAQTEVVFKDSFKRTHLLKELSKDMLGEKVAVAGRIVFRRIMGKFGFCKIQDVEGAIQVSVGINELQEDRYTFYKKMIDIGDFIGVSGEVYETQTGELTVKAESVTLLSKAMRPLPEKFHGLTDIDARYRQRYLDLVMNQKTREVMLGRSKLTNFIRNYLAGQGFMEVETPILQSAVCGASAKPFFTKHNALDKICNLRIAPEVYLKQVIAGGFDKVFELGKDFRNEGMDTQHLQEFTMLEWYASYWNFEDNIKFYREFIQKLLM
ncbi:MAG: lysine--tRNA ligase, partial [Clostridia bacterium]|nr:lysine--tRNA ligase [Clostridia bacterium]